jgi:hypothetical protein
MKRLPKEAVYGLLLFVLAGCGWSSKGALEAVVWDPPVLAKQGCPDLSGTYFDVPENSSPDPGLSWVLQFGIGSKYNFPITVVDYRKIPFVAVKRPRVSMPDQKPTNEILTHEDTSAFYKTAITTVRHQGWHLEAILMDSNGVPYQKVARDLNHQLIGCDKGALVIRDMSAHVGSEGGGGSADASEMRITKLPDGRLRFDTQDRGWGYGLWGIKGDPVTGRKSHQRSNSFVFDIAPNPDR